MNGNSKPLKPRGPTEYDLKAQPPADFERMCFRLIRLQFSAVEKPHDTSDGGADALLAKDGGYARAWQAKHYSGEISWAECKASFESAVKNYRPDEYTFCFPRNLTSNQQKTFDRHFRQTDNPVKVNYWSADELQARLTESSEGRVVAEHFFDSDANALEAVKRAALAKGELDTPEDALQRLQPVGEYLASADPYFSYSAAVYKAGAPVGPAPREAIMSVHQAEGGVVSRLDVVPNDSEAVSLYAPKGKMTFKTEAYQQVAEALERGETVTADDVEVTFEQLPPALSAQIGKPLRGQVTIGPAEAPHPRPAPWDARMAVSVGSERAQLDMNLKPVDPPDDWDGCLEGHAGGLTVRLLFRRTAKGGEGTLTYRYSLGNEPARMQLQALRVMTLASRVGGDVTIAERKGGKRKLTLESGASDDSGELTAVAAFLENIVEIEKWSSAEISVDPASFTNDHFRGLAIVASALRKGGFDILFHGLELSVGPDHLGLLAKGGPLVFERALTANVLNQDVELGKTRFALSEYEWEDLGPEPAGTNLVRLSPKGNEPAELFEALRGHGAHKPPPPPPRKQKNKRRGKRSKRKGGRSS
jgi:hypothetical protein